MSSMNRFISTFSSWRSIRSSSPCVQISHGKLSSQARMFNALNVSAIEIKDNMMVNSCERGVSKNLHAVSANSLRAHKVRANECLSVSKFGIKLYF